MQRFALTRFPDLIFGGGEITRLPEALRSRAARSVLVVFSRSVFQDREVREGVVGLLDQAGARAEFARYDLLPGKDDTSAPFDAPRGSVAEASPDVVDGIARDWFRRSQAPPDLVIAIGGGSAIDTGKAVSVACTEEGSIEELLEGVGTRAPLGTRTPFVAIPTTAGTGSEATKNAVLSRPGPQGFKKSLRHDNFVPDLALIDPTLHLTTPHGVTAATGLDAITQLLEAYVSTQATPVTDALALDGIAAAGRSFSRAVERGDSDPEARAGMAYAAYLSGVCLANAGLGTVHGLAGAAGARLAVPHGAFCGLLLPVVTRSTVAALRSERNPLGALAKYAAAGRALTGRSTGTMELQIDALLARLEEFVRVGKLRRLEDYGLTHDLSVEIAAHGGNKANPYKFSQTQLAELLTEAL